MQLSRILSHFLYQLTCPLTVASFIASGCARQDDSGFPPNEKFPNDIEAFDASVPDGGETAPVAACTEGAPYQLDNRFSPYRGGDETVAVEVAHFSNLYCIHCADFAAVSYNLWARRPDFQSSVRIYFHHTDFTFRHRAAVAAGNQGMDKFWDLQDFIYSKMLDADSPSEGAILDFVEKTLHLDMVQFNRDLKADETYAFLRWDIEQAMAAGVKGTPTVYVCGRALPNRGYLEDEVDGYLRQSDNN